MGNISVSFNYRNKLYFKNLKGKWFPCSGSITNELREEIENSFTDMIRDKNAFSLRRLDSIFIEDGFFRKTKTEIRSLNTMLKMMGEI